MEDLESMLLQAMDGTPEDKNKVIAKILLDMRSQDREEFETVKKNSKKSADAAEQATKERKRVFRMTIICVICAGMIWAAALALIFGVVVEAETTYSTVEQSTDGGGNAYYNANGRAQYIISGEDE